MFCHKTHQLGFFLLFLCFLRASQAGPHGEQPWCYKDSSCDARTWAGMCKTGQSQSPVDFSRGNINENRTQIKLRLNKAYFDVQDKFYIKNNGHTIQVQLKEDFSSNLQFDGDGLTGSYMFSQFHFHWGSTDDTGSEHTVNGKHYPLELHLVHYNTMYKNLKEAVGSKDVRALSVLGIFFKLSSSPNPALQPIIDAMKNSQTVQENVSTIKRSLNISALLPEDLGLFRYYGSLTTPGCFELVHWNVFKKPVPVSEAQLEAFRNVMDSHGMKLVDNYRPTLPLGERKLTEYQVVQMEIKPENANVEPKTKKNGVSLVSANFVIVLMAVMFSVKSEH